MKKVIFITVLILLVVLLGRNLTPFSPTMFQFHDETQPARIAQFSLNLENWHIPPRIAPDFSFKMGYPIFNFYAPSAYWITSIIKLLGFDVVDSLKISFLLSLVVAFGAMFLFLTLFFDFYPALLGAVSYISFLYIPVEIFVRGNLAEMWFLSFFPLVLYLLHQNVQKKSYTRFILAVLTTSFILSVHNILSLIFIPISLVYILILRKNIWLNFVSFIFGLLLSAYFILAAFLEIGLVYAREVASSTNFRSHFLCPYQLWQSPWGYGGSTAGCLNDGMSFKIGKVQLIFSFLGIVLLLLKRKKNPLTLFFAFLTLVSLFLTTYQSQFIWEFLSPIFSYFQFPWRFISLSLLGISFFVSFFWQNFNVKFKSWLIVFLIFFLLIYSSKYFTGQFVSKKEFEKKYLQSSYIEKKVAYKVAEYLPKTVDYQYWRSLESGKDSLGLKFNFQIPVEADNNLTVIKNTPWYKKVTIHKLGLVSINIHYFPFWEIIVNGNKIIPQKFDLLGRPIITIKRPSTVIITYKQSFIERLADFFTILSLIILFILGVKNNLWNKKSKSLV